MRILLLILCAIASVGCKVRTDRDSGLSAAAPEFAFRPSNGQVDMLVAHQMTYLSEMAYKSQKEIQVFADQFNLSLDAVEDINGTFYYIVSTDRYIIVAFRGTEKNAEDLRTDFNFFHRSFLDGFAHCGFCKAYSLVKERLRFSLEYLYANRPREVYFTGHSLGGALANIAALDMKLHMKEVSEQYPSTPYASFDVAGLYTFGSPRVFDRKGATKLDQIVTNHYRFIYGNDLVVKVPFKAMGFLHAGQGFIFRKNCELSEGKLESKDSFMRRLMNLGSLFRKSGLTDHKLKNYRNCIITGQRS